MMYVYVNVYLPKYCYYSKCILNYILKINGSTFIIDSNIFIIICSRICNKSFLGTLRLLFYM